MDQSVAGTELDRDHSEAGAPATGPLARRIAARLRLDEIDAVLVLPGGWSIGPRITAGGAVIRILDTPTLLRLLVDTETAFAEGYASGRIEIQGDLEPLLERIYLADLRRFAPSRRPWVNPFEIGRAHV